MLFYRGDNRSPLDSVIQKVGFTAKPPAVTMTAAEARAFLTKELASATLADLGMTWRKQTPGYLVATAMTREGSFEQMTYLYEIEIPDEVLTARSIAEKGVVGAAFPLSEALTYTKYFILHDGTTYADATMIAFCHGPVNTKEATFLTAIPRPYIKGYLQKALTLERDPVTGAKRGYDVKKVPFAPMRTLGVNLTEAQLKVAKEGPKRIAIPNIFQK